MGGVKIGLGLLTTPSAGAHMESGATGFVLGGFRYQILQQVFNCGAGDNCYLQLTLQHTGVAANEEAFVYFNHPGAVGKTARVPMMGVAGHRKLVIPGCGNTAITIWRKKPAAGQGNATFIGDLYIDDVIDNCHSGQNNPPFGGTQGLPFISCPSSHPDCAEAQLVENFVNPNVPTLSQWGLILLGLLVMCMG
ncbi:MAG: IPTL-CTERM sorting domain-containing protein, partial [Bacteroidota bacterium]